MFKQIWKRNLQNKWILPNNELCYLSFCELPFAAQYDSNNRGKCMEMRHSCDNDEEQKKNNTNSAHTENDRMRKQKQNNTETLLDQPKKN